MSPSAPGYNGATISGDLAKLETHLVGMGDADDTRGAVAASAAPASTLKTVYAPAGKLGIVVDSSANGPTIHSVRDSSPLTNSVFVGDKLISIDEVNCQSMSAGAVTKLMARKSSQPER